MLGCDCKVLWVVVSSCQRAGVATTCSSLGCFTVQHLFCKEQLLLIVTNDNWSSNDGEQAILSSSKSPAGLFFQVFALTTSCSHVTVKGGANDVRGIGASQCRSMLELLL
jgi:hypothetical protein